MNDNVQFGAPNGNMAGSAAFAMKQGGRQAFYGGANDAVASGMAYLMGELEKTDTKIREPLSSVT